MVATASSGPVIRASPPAASAISRSSTAARVLLGRPFVYTKYNIADFDF